MNSDVKKGHAREERDRCRRAGTGWMTLAVVLAVLVLGLTVLACTPTSVTTPAAGASQQRPATLTVFAAASLTDAFKELGAIFEAESGTPVTFNFGASSQLRTQLEQGARADVFASADQAQMDRARQSSTLTGADTAFSSNRLVIITPAANPAGIQNAADLGRPGVKVVTAGPEVPIGAYTLSMFERMNAADVFGADFQKRATANIVSREPNVRQVVAKIQLGEGDAAVVYRSDVTPQAADRIQTVAIPDELNASVTYPIVLVANGPHPEAGAAFIALALSPVGQGVLERWNFTPVGPTAQSPPSAPR